MTITPLSARLFFRLRTPINCAIIAIIFMPLVAILSVMPGGWIVTLALIAALYFLFFYVLQNRSVGFACPHCQKHLTSNTPWVCGSCKETNRNIDDFPFVHRCAHCSAEPKAYRCHHCSDLIFLGNDRQQQNFAYSLDNRPPDITPPTEDESLGRQKQKDDILHEIEMTDLAAKLEEKKLQLELGKKKTPVEEIETNFTKYFARVMGSQEYAQKQRAEADEKYKDQPELQKRAHEAIDAWLRNRT